MVFDGCKVFTYEYIALNCLAAETIIVPDRYFSIFARMGKDTT